MEKKEILEALQAELKEFKTQLPDNSEQIKALEAEVKRLSEVDNTEFETSLKDIQKGLEEQGLFLAKMKTDNAPSKTKSTRDLLVDSGALKGLIEKTNQTEFEVKAVGTVTTANVVDAVVQPVMSILGTQGELYEVNRSIQQTILDHVDMGSSDKATIVYVDEVEGEGSIATTAEGVAKSQNDVDFQEVTVNAIKKTGLVKVTEESLDDISYMGSEINRVLTEKLKIAESLDVLTDVLASATTYSLTDYDDTVESADIIDAIVAATAQSDLSGFNPTSIVMHPVDIAAFQLVKSTNIPRIETVAGRMMVNGLVIVKTTQITKGTFVLGDLSKYRVRRYKNKLVMGWDADDFSKNLRSIIAESRYLKYISSNEKTSLIKGTYATIQAALLVPVA